MVIKRIMGLPWETVRSIVSKIEDRIIEIRAVRVLIDYELAELYQVELKTLLQAVQRNSERFPSDFMFRLTPNEYAHLKKIRNLPTSHGGRRVPPNAFTEQGVAMLSSVLNSNPAIKMNVEIMRAFVKLRTLVENQTTLLRKLGELDGKVDKHDKQIQGIIDAIKSLVSVSSKPQRLIGFKRE
jgi:hypothetical protein